MLGRASDQKAIIAAALSGLGMAAFKQGKLASARSLMRDGLRVLQMVTNNQEIMPYLKWLARAVFAEARHEPAARQLGTSAVLHETLSSPTLPNDLENHDFVALARAALGEDTYTSALEES
jgi:hypothetical protein